MKMMTNNPEHPHPERKTNRDMDPQLEGVAQGEAAAPAVSKAADEGPVGAAYASQPAAATVPAYGGLRGGRRRSDGLVPGSPEAEEADRRKARARMARARARRRKTGQEEPPPLPSMAVPVDALDTATVSARADEPGGPSPGVLDQTAPQPWQPEALQPLCDQLLAAVEEGRLSAFIARCTEAGLSQRLVKEIEQDARFPRAAKVLLSRSLPRLAAKYLNRAGLSAAWEDEVAVLSGIIILVQHDRRLQARLAELIAAHRAAQAVEEHG